MLRGMVFVDHMNFDIALKSYYKSELGMQAPKLDYNTVFKGIATRRGNCDYIKTIIFVPKPDDFLMNDQALNGYYKWTQGLKNAKYIDIVEGRYLARPTDPDKPMDILDRKSYYKVEKGTDINLAIHALSHAYHNSFDIAFIVSGDTDYANLYNQLKCMGKLVVVVAVKGQVLSKITSEVDDYIILKEIFFQDHIR